MSNKIVIFHLSRYGFAAYAAGLINNLPSNDYRIFVSAYASIPLKKSCTRIKTYRNKAEFFFATIFHLPLLLIQLVKLKINKNIRSAYFVGFHAWDLPIIFCCKLLNIKTLYTIHDGILHEGERYITHKIVQNSCIRLADELIFLTSFVKNSTLQQFSRKKPASVIPHGPIKVFETPPPRAHARRLRLLFLGRIGKYKGIEMLIKAVERCSDENWEKLTIAGNQLFRFQSPNHPKIQVINRWLSDQEIANLLHEHHVLVLPYTSATQSGVLMLGTSAAIPIICTKVGGLPEQLAADEAVWINPDSDELANAIHLLSSNRELYDRIRERLIAKERESTWQDISQKLADIMHRL